MKKFLTVLSVTLLMFALSWADEGKDKSDLWAAISVNQPVFHNGDTRNLSIYFVMINDSNAIVNPKYRSSRLFINGKELKEWMLIVGNGPGPADDNLPPDGSLEFTKAMGEYFKKPGIYKVRWEGENFNAPEITVRVLPKLNK